MNHDPIEKFDNISVCQSLIFACSMNSGEHNLPDSPFASPTKSAALVHDSFTATETENTSSRVGVDVGVGSKIDGGSNHLRPPALEIPSPSSYFFPMHRCVRLYFPWRRLCPWTFCHPRMKWFSECNEQAVLRSRCHGDVKFTIGSEWYPSLIIVSTNGPLYSDYASQITTF